MTAAEVQRLRRRLRLSQAGLAMLVGVTANTVARWERGEMKMQPAMDRLIRLAVKQQEPDRRRAQTRRRP